MTFKTITFTTISYLLILNSALNAQIFDQNKALDLFKTERKSRISKDSHNNTTEVQMIFSGLYIFYKSAISSQDSRSCTFHQSCSDYGITALKTMGLKGVFHTFDRLSRCNNLSRRNYPVVQKTGLLYDPVMPDSISTYQVGKVIDL